MRTTHIGKRKLFVIHAVYRPSTVDISQDRVLPSQYIDRHHTLERSCWSVGRRGKLMERGKIDPAPSNVSEPIITKIGIGDEVGDLYPCAKCYYDLIGVFFSPSRSQGLQSDSASFWVLATPYCQAPCADFFTINTSNSVF